jgi:hypothetical protein
MNEVGGWAIVFYVDEQGNSPVEEFLDQLDQKTRVRFAWSIEQLRLRNVAASGERHEYLPSVLFLLQRAAGRLSARVSEEEPEDPAQRDRDRPGATSRVSSRGRR